MKKLMLILAACVALTACKKEVLTKGTPFQKGETVTISAGTGGNGGNAKVSGEDAISSINFKWDEGDEIKVTVGTASSNFQLSTGAGNIAATFTGTMPADGTNFNVQYPVTAPDLTTQDYVAGKVPKDKMLFTANNCTKDQMAELEMAYAILKLQFTGSSQEVSKIVVETVDYSSPKSYTLNISGVTLTSTPTPFLMVVDPMTAKLKVTLFDNNDDEITSFTTSSAQTLTAGQCLRMPEKPLTAEPECLCFTALQGNSSVTMEDHGRNLEYSVDNGTHYDPWDGSMITLTNVGDKVYIRASATNTRINNTFSTTGKLKVSGNIMYLLSTDPATIMEDVNAECFQDLFYECDGITDASELLLPATTLANNCYNAMFSGCTSLTAAPALPATTLESGCYGYMFSGCTSLTTAPVLAATTLKSSCYMGMFSGCTHLTTAPALPATTLANNCYREMFSGCTSLTTAPTLSATTLKSNCYCGMFSGCTSLQTAPALPATELEATCYSSMFMGCTSLTAAPTLSALTLKDRCYQDMFSGCSSLMSVTMLATAVSGEEVDWSVCLDSWLYGAANSGTVHVANSTVATAIANTLPSGWTATAH